MCRKHDVLNSYFIVFFNLGKEVTGLLLYVVVSNWITFFMELFQQHCKQHTLCCLHKHTGEVPIRRRSLAASLADKPAIFLMSATALRHLVCVCVCARGLGECLRLCVCVCAPKTARRVRVRPSSSNHTLTPGALPHSVSPPLPLSFPPSYLLPPPPRCFRLVLCPFSSVSLCGTVSAGRTAAGGHRPRRLIESQTGCLTARSLLTSHRETASAHFKRRRCCVAIRKVTRRGRRCFPHLFIFIVIFKQKNAVSRALEGALKFLSGIYWQTQMSGEEVRTRRGGY